jgi:hypothetical protein
MRLTSGPETSCALSRRRAASGDLRLHRRRACWHPLKVNHSEIVSFLWGVADLIRDTFKRGKYQDVILPLTVLRRLDCVLADKKEKVLKRKSELKTKGLGDLDSQLRRTSGYAFYNTSLYDFDRLMADSTNGSILQEDLLETLIALPEQLFYNTSIATYVWVVTNRKAPERRGKVQLIDATSFWVPMRKSLGDKRPALDAAVRVNTRENVRLTFDQKVEHVIQDIVDSNFELYKRITDDRSFGETLKNYLFDQYVRAHRNAEELIQRGESKTLEFKSTLRWSLRDKRQDDKGVTHAVLKTVAAFLNTEGGDLLIGVADDGQVVGIEHDRLESDDKFMRHLSQVVRNGLGDRSATCIDPKVQVVHGRTVCVVSCRRSPEPVFLKWKGVEVSVDGDFFVRSGPGTVKLEPAGAGEYIRTRFRST